MTAKPTWEVSLHVTGPITVQKRIQMRQPMGSEPADPSYSDISISGNRSGLEAKVVTSAQSEHLAHQAAVFFFGRMLDGLALELACPMYLGFNQPAHQNEEVTIKRIVQKEELEKAFSEAQRLGKEYPSFLRSLGWFRKGLYTDDPFDRFLAFWNAIAQTASKYHQEVPEIDQERAMQSGRNQIWSCFHALWGDVGQWKVITGNSDWIQQHGDLRHYLAQGAKEVTITNVQAVVEKLPVLEQLTHAFLLDWRAKYLMAGPSAIKAEFWWAKANAESA